MQKKSAGSSQRRVGRAGRAVRAKTRPGAGAKTKAKATTKRRTKTAAAAPAVERALAPALVEATSTAATFAGPLKSVRFTDTALADMVGASRTLLAAARRLEHQTVATVAVKTRSGLAIQEHRGRITDQNYRGFRLDDRQCERAHQRLETLGFEILHVGRFAITVRGPAALFQDVLKTPIVLNALPARTLSRSEPRMLAWKVEEPNARHLFLCPASGLTVPATSEASVDHFVFMPPAAYFAARLEDGPTPAYHHLKASRIRQLLNVEAAGRTGKGVRLCVIDSGFQIDHPYYRARKFRHKLVTAGGGDPSLDGNGHGTGILANALAVAPEAEFVLVNDTPSAQAAFDAALDENPHIISCSWGWPYEQSFPMLEATIRSAIRDDGITVLFAAGNGDMAWPGSMPDVISVGGVYADAQGALQASSYASGFMSSLYPDRRVPDLSGLVGQHPRGIYIVLPTSPGSSLDRGFGGRPFPRQDETQAHDGWVVASGTSSATPQLAGIVALMLEKKPGLSPAQVKSILTQTARPVSAGRNALGFPAVGHPNVAVGFGLANAHAAVAAAT
jgi:hypothetical protein